MEHFRLKTRDDVVRFEELADTYAKNVAGFSLGHLSLAGAYDYCNQREDGGKLFSAMLDVFINFLLLYCDSHTVRAVWNANFSKGKLEGGTVLDSEAKFIGKMDVHRFNSSFVLRYRALWDKLMGLLVMLEAPDLYEKYFSARSRKNAFKKIAVDRNLMDEVVVSSIISLLDEFDNEFRTAEAHGTGALRKWTLSMESMSKNPSIKLIGYWNVVNDFMIELGKAFRPDSLKAREDNAL